jgi:glycosyltransferase involved in cell wall biosynthesis
MVVHYVSAYSREKNIGKAINDSIRQLNADDEDWICSTDHDILWLLPDSKAQLEDILAKTTFDVLGPLTNRLGGPTQLVPDMYDETDILRHIAVAQDRDNNYRGDVIGTHEFLAAFCLCFRVKTWKALGGFQEGNLSFDWLFSEMAKKMGFKLGICAGIYVFHLYRLGKNKDDYSHLL